jgi:hypothetical protein
MIAGRRLRGSWAVGAALMLGAAPASAQIPYFLPELPTFGPDWTDFGLPKIYYAGADGLTVGIYYAQIRHLAAEDYEAPPPYRASISIDGSISTSGSKRLRLEARMPRMWYGWRAVATLEGRRAARERFYGVGNDVTVDGANVTDAAPHYYRFDYRRYYARGEIQRAIIGPLRVLAGLHAERWGLDTLPGASLLAANAAAGTVTPIQRGVAEVSGQIGLVLDTRDDEPATRNGVLLEAILSRADSGTAGDVTYTRATVSAVAHLQLSERIGVAARVAGQSFLAGAPPVGSFFRIEASDQPIDGIGGGNTHRGIRAHRLLDGDKVFGNFDLRYDLLSEPTLYRVTLVGFVDAARVFPSGDFRLTTEDLIVGGGAGVFLHFFRSGILGTTFGVGPDGAVVNLHLRWPF